MNYKIGDPLLYKGDKCVVTEVNNSGDRFKVILLGKYNVSGTNVITWVSYKDLELNIKFIHEQRNKNIDKIL